MMYPSASGLAALASTGRVASRLSTKNQISTSGLHMFFNKYNLECTKEVGLNPVHFTFLEIMCIKFITKAYCQFFNMQHLNSNHITMSTTVTLLSVKI